jgi:signal transduction histidine kinase
MMETLMARLGHDLRTPLTPLFVLIPLMRERVSDPSLLRMLDICSKSAAAMNRLVDRAQTLVTLSATVRPERLEHITLLSVVEQAVADNADSISQRNVSCSHDIDHQIIVKAIPDQLRELFSNLISNAVRFSPKNGAIRISAERQDTAVTVAVHDEGIGLDPENLERVFDEFFKADESRHDIDAPGLGLSICKRIVSNHHGRIWAESPGIEKGTTIRFTINEHDPACRYDAKES